MITNFGTEFAEIKIGEAGKYITIEDYRFTGNTIKLNATDINELKDLLTMAQIQISKSKNRE